MKTDDWREMYTSEEPVLQLMEEVAPELVAHQGIVAILDALGSRRMWADSDKNDLLKKRLHLRDFIRSTFVNFRGEKLVDGPRSTPTRYLVDVETRVQFVSDTIVISIVPPPEVKALVVYDALYDLLTALMTQAIRDGALLRGAVSSGELYVGTDFLLGPAADEAAAWFEAADWAGIILTPSMQRHLEMTVLSPSGSTPLGFVRWDVPLGRKAGDTRGVGELWTVAWPWWAKNLRAEIIRLFSQTPAEIDVARKMNNTLRYFDYLWSGRASMGHHYIDPRSRTGRILKAEDGPVELFDKWFAKQARDRRKGKKSERKRSR